MMCGVEPAFVAIFLVAGGVLLVTELVGVVRKQRGDTISEGWRWIDQRLPAVLRWAYRVTTAGVLVWLLLHLAGPWG